MDKLELSVSWVKHARNLNSNSCIHMHLKPTRENSYWILPSHMQSRSLQFINFNIAS